MSSVAEPPEGFSRIDVFKAFWTRRRIGILILVVVMGTLGSLGLRYWWTHRKKGRHDPPPAGDTCKTSHDCKVKNPTFECDPKTNRCVAPRVACKGDDECTGGEKCLESKCVLPSGACNVDEECTGAEKCIDYKCVLPSGACNVDGECKGGEKCIDYKCVGPPAPPVIVELTNYYPTAPHIPQTLTDKISFNVTLPDAMTGKQYKLISTMMFTSSSLQTPSYAELFASKLVNGALVKLSGTGITKAPLGWHAATDDRSPKTQLTGGDIINVSLSTLNPKWTFLAQGPTAGSVFYKLHLLLL
jgi:hypothetical protein